MAVYLFDHWKELERSLFSARTLYLFCDFDGTLAKIVRKPESAHLEKKNRKLLRSLASNRNFKIAIISGRLNDQLKRIVNVDGIYYVGNHGLEISGPRLNFKHPGAMKKAKFLRAIAGELRLELDSIPGVFVEDKGLTVSVHYRMAKPSQRKRVVETVEGIVAKYKVLRLTTGKFIVEARPRVRWHKGLAALKLIEDLGRRGGVIFIGDDTTDEDAFRSLKGKITIRVMHKHVKTNARYYLRSVNEVWQFIGLLSKFAKHQLDL